MNELDYFKLKQFGYLQKYIPQFIQKIKNFFQKKLKQNLQQSDFCIILINQLGLFQLFKISGAKFDNLKNIQQIIKLIFNIQNVSNYYLQAELNSWFSQQRSKFW
ncbi:hypothetical protein ABPG72_019348 [Tetrahymena utriculariae]